MSSTPSSTPAPASVASTVTSDSGQMDTSVESRGGPTTSQPPASLSLSSPSLTSLPLPSQPGGGLPPPSLFGQGQHVPITPTVEEVNRALGNLALPQATQSPEEFNTLFRFLAVNQESQEQYVRRLQEQEKQTKANLLAFKRRFKEESRSQDLLHDQEKVVGFHLAWHYC